MRSVATLLILFTVSCHGYAQVASKNIAQGKWSSAQSTLRKSLKKDTLNAEAKFVFARFFITESNPAFSPDSALIYTKKAMSAWKQTPVKQREKLQKMLIDSMSITSLRTTVDSIAFEYVVRQNTQQGYSDFIANFFDAPQVPKATELRDELAYVEALRLNSVISFREYFEHYPQSHRATDAREHYELLLYEERTKSGKLDDYRAFLKEFPGSAYRSEAERFIFEVSTVSGEIDDYLHFIKEFPTGVETSKAKSILYYLMREHDVARPASFDSDSLRLLDQRNAGYWVPFYKNGMYGFMNDDGEEVMASQFQSIDSTYFCGDVSKDFIITSAGVYSRDGTLLLRKTPSKATDLGFGFISIFENDCQTVVHQSGFQVGEDCVSDVRIVEHFVALKKDSKWKLYSFNHHQLLESSYDDVTHVDKLIILKRYGKNIVVTASQIAATAEGRPLDESLVFDEVRAWGEGNLWVKNGVLEGVLDQGRAFVIPLDRQVLTKTSFGFLRKKDSKVQVVGVAPALESKQYDAVQDYGDWLELRIAKQSTLYRVPLKKIVANGLDSVWIKNKVAFGVRRDSLNVYAGAGLLASFERQSAVTFIPGGDSSVYFWVPEKKTKAVYEASMGKKLFVADFEDIEVIGRDMFVVTRKNKKQQPKKGLLRRDGKLAQPAEYDAIIATSSGYLSLLKDKKFGLYDVSKQRLIKAEYDRNVLPYAKDYFIAYKGGYGIINATEQPVTGFDFEEIRYWNDSSAWVKKNFSWSVYSFKTNESKLNRIKSFQILKDHDGEIVARIQQDNYFGVVSNRRGILITPTFSEVLNLGSPEKPFYFTEKRVEEAGIYVVIYYNSNGKLVRKQVYEDEEYEKIYCDN